MTAVVQSYSGPLGQLLFSLRDPLAAAPNGTWFRRQLSRGALVSVVRGPDGRRVVMLSRATPPKDERGAKAWTREVDTFLHWLGLTAWEPVYELPHGALDSVEVGVWSAFAEPREADAGRPGGR